MLILKNSPVVQWPRTAGFGPANIGSNPVGANRISYRAVPKF